MEAITRRLAPYKSQFPLARLLDQQDDEFISGCIQGNEQLPKLMELKKDLELYTDSAKNELNSVIDCNQELFIHIPKSLHEIDGEINKLHLALSQSACTLNLNTQSIYLIQQKASAKLEEINKLSEEESQLKRQIAILDGIAEIRSKLGQIQRYQQFSGRRQVFMAVFRRVADLIEDCGINANDFREQFINLLREEVFHSIHKSSSAGLDCMFYCFEKIGKQDVLMNILYSGLAVAELGNLVDEAAATSPFDFASFYANVRDNEKIDFMISSENSMAVEIMFKALIEVLRPYIAQCSPINNHTAFYTNFSHTQRFLAQFKPSGPQQEAFLGLWNTSEYFQIIQGRAYDRLRPVFGEQSLEVFTRLDVGSILWETLSGLWSEQVFLASMTPDFVRLTLELVAKYCLHITVHQAKLSLPTLNNIIKQSNFVAGKISGNFAEKLEVGFAARIKQLCVDKLKAVLEPCQGMLVETVTTKCAESIEGIGTVVSSFRMTNKPMPTTPSAYVKAFVAPFNGIADADLLSKIVSNVLDRYYNTLTTLLERINTEEEKFLKYHTGEEVSDKEKMIEQLRLDTKQFFDFIGAKHPTYDALPIVYSIKAELNLS